MPLTSLGNKMRKQIEKEYGKVKGKSVFYAMAHKHPSWHIKAKVPFSKTASKRTASFRKHGLFSKKPKVKYY